MTNDFEPGELGGMSIDLAQQRLTRRRLVGGLAATVAAGRPVGAAMLGDPPAVRLRRGMNLWPWFSLTREFPPPRSDYDWPPYQEARPVPTRGDLAALRKIGVDFVRLPVDPGPLLGFSADRRAALMDDVIKAIALAHSEDLSVVLNLHPNGATHHWNATNLLGSSKSPMFSQYIDLVRALALRLSRFDKLSVAFEPVNEPPQNCVASNWPSTQRTIVRAARVAAPHLTLVVTGACGSMIAGLEALDPSSVGDENVIYTFHFYEPYVFSHQGAPWMTSEPMYRYLNSVPWPSGAGSKEATLAAVRARMGADRSTPAYKKREIGATIERALDQYFDARPDHGFIERYFRRVETWARRHGIDPGRVLLGEFGALRSDERYVASASIHRANYIRDVRKTAEAFGLPWAFWNLFDGMGLTIDDYSREFDPEIVVALGLGMPERR
jgi:hypothetical protein